MRQKVNSDIHLITTREKKIPTNQFGKIFSFSTRSFLIAIVIAISSIFMSASASEALSGPYPDLANRKDSVFYIGDSLTFGMFWEGKIIEHTQNAHLRLAGEWAQPGLSVIDTSPFVRKNASKFPYTVFLALGSADCYRKTPPAVYQAHLTNMIKTLGTKRKIALINIYCRFDDTSSNLEKQYNGIQIRMAKMFPNVATYDWVGYVKANPKVLDPKDWTHVHCGVYGSIMRSKFYIRIALKTATPYK